MNGSLRRVDLRRLDLRRVDLRRVDLRRQWIPLVLAVSGWVVLGISALGPPGALRFAAVFGFALAVPGIAVVRLLPLTSLLERAVLSIAISASLAALVAEGTYISGNLQPAVVLTVLSCLCTAAALTEVIRTGSAP